MTKTAGKKNNHNANKDYVSNPYSVLLESFKTVISLNFGTFWSFVVVGVMSFLVGFLLIASVIYSFEFEISSFWAVLVVAAFIIWGVILLASYTKYALETAKLKVISFNEALSFGYQKAAGYMGLMLLTLLVVLLGLALFIIPGLILMFWLLLAPYIYIDQDVTVVEAMKRSKDLVTKQPAEIIGLMAAGISLSIVSILPVFGLVFAIFFNVAWQIAWSCRYLSALRLIDKKLDKPPTSPLNYWAILFAVAALVVTSSLGAAA